MPAAYKPMCFDCIESDLIEPNEGWHVRSVDVQPKLICLLSLMKPHSKTLQENHS